MADAHYGSVVLEAYEDEVAGAAYFDAFRALEAIGPTEDQPVLAALTVHAVQPIDWLREEAAGAAEGELEHGP